ncbi:MAG TPA: hypothetical protein DET40_03115 [Lentisphaeria bacterium]|nr:MAG: hypothetical protein A2X45_12980 [Lentisphaerae bacterium GWF2_50_93]HCE42521.1 hypothetical protein [Lentisphaeria bacterium]
MKSSYKHFSKPSRTVEQRVEKILKTLTLEEKIDLLGGMDKGTREIPGKFPQIKFADGPVGVHWWRETSTTYPALIALAASWDKELSYKVGWALGRDCRAVGVHVLLAPGVNIYRSAFCGRNFEYLGEDPCLASKMVVPYIKGLQDMGVSATVKHFAVNNQEYSRHHVSSDADERTLREIYLPAFKAAVEEAGTGALMTAYNLVNGQHCSENDWLINKVLKGEWKFDGVAMSDWVSVYSVVGPANAGLDLEMPAGKYFNREKLLPAIRGGLVTEECVNDKIRRLIRLSICFGWLDRPQKLLDISMDDPEAAKVALEVSRRGTVLLKNQDRTLPININRIRKIAVVGYHAGNNVICGGGSAYTPPNHVVNLLDGIRKEAEGNVEIAYERGINPMRHRESFGMSEFFSPDGRMGLFAEYFNNSDFEGEPALKRLEDKISNYWGPAKPAENIQDNYSVRWTGEIRPRTEADYVFYLHSVDGIFRAWVDDEIVFDSNNQVRSTLQRGLVHLKGGDSHKIRVEYVQSPGWNIFGFGWESNDLVRIEYERAMSIVKNADLVILSTGYTNETEGEGHDRKFSLPDDEIRLINDVTARNSNVVAVLYAGGNVEMESWIDKVKSLLYVWYPGQEGGTAVSEILFGKVNPSGKLPATFERKAEDRSSFKCYNDDDKDNRIQMADGVMAGYRHFDSRKVKPLFPFGFGLSYTSFKYENFKMSSARMKSAGKITVSFDIRNTGELAGTESCQLYIGDVEASHVRPVKELKDFAKVELQPDEKKRVKFEISSAMLKYFNPDLGKWVAEPGEFKAYVGASCEEIMFSESFKLVK